MKRGLYLVCLIIFILFLSLIPGISADTGPGVYMLKKAGLKDRVLCIAGLKECIGSDYGILTLVKKAKSITSEEETIVLGVEEGKDVDKTKISRIFFSDFDERDFIGFCATMEFKQDPKCKIYDESVLVVNINEDLNNIEFKKGLIEPGESRTLCKVYSGADLLRNYGKEIKYKGAYVYSLCPQKDPKKLSAGIDKETIEQGMAWPKDSSFLFVEKNYIQASHNVINFIANANGVNIKDVALFDLYGSSMQPTIFSGNKVITKIANQGELKEGMIVGYLDDYNKLTFHRIRAIYPMYDMILVQGDNLDSFEEIKTMQIKYIVIGVLYT